ncbi:MAG: hypothetical protein LBI86_06545 [Treponema sp.]|jgi:hypothetical protein|nr:hypothetical protein [Treponema sp.]
MSTYNIQSGGVSYRVEAASETEAKNAVASHQFGDGMVGLFLYALYFMFFLLPKLCVRLVGWIFGLLFKAGFVGKIIQTVIVGLVGGILALILLAGTLIPALPLPEFLEGIANFIALLAGLGGLGYWYFRYHYDTVKFMPAGNFSILLTRCFTICFYGSIVLMIVAEGKKMGNLGYALAFNIPFIIALIYWLIKTKPYARPRPDIAGWTEAAQAGDPIAQYNLALAYDDGWGIKGDKSQALE